jgi:hypothetical protein
MEQYLTYNGKYLEFNNKMLIGSPKVPPIAFWPFEDNLNDSIGGYDFAQLYSAPYYVTGKINKCARFVGGYGFRTTDLDIRNTILSKNYTIMFWYNIDTSDGNQFMMGSLSDSFNLIYNSSSPGANSITLNYAGSQMSTGGFTVLGDWYFFALRVLNRHIEIWNGNDSYFSKLMQMDGWDDLISCAELRFGIIGAYTGFFIGRYDQMRLFNYYLSDSDLMEYWNNGLGK